jgi:rhodanese-related sulfurtransferase
LSAFGRAPTPNEKLAGYSARTWTGVYSFDGVQQNFRTARNASVVAAALLSSVVGCKRAHQTEPVTVGQLAILLKSPDPPRLYDANGARTRNKYGVIPGATLLPSSHDYSLDLLPGSKRTPLVFYCASTWCGAAEAAADRAVQAGYSLVNVLPAGIKGWTEAGMPTKKPD